MDEKNLFTEQRVRSVRASPPDHSLRQFDDAIGIAKLTTERLKISNA
jgi:hypothetical protein